MGELAYKSSSLSADSSTRAQLADAELICTSARPYVSAFTPAFHIPSVGGRARDASTSTQQQGT